MRWKSPPPVYLPPCDLEDYSFVLFFVRQWSDLVRWRFTPWSSLLPRVGKVRNTPHPPTIMMLTMTMAGTVMKIGTTPLTEGHIWILSTREARTSTREEGAVAEARREPRRAQTDPGGMAAGDEHWTPARTAKGSTAAGAAPGTVTTWRTSMSEEEWEGGIGAGTSLMITLHPQNPPESWSHWRNLSTSFWWRTDPAKVEHTTTNTHILEAHSFQTHLSV